MIYELPLQNYISVGSSENSNSDPELQKSMQLLLKLRLALANHTHPEKHDTITENVGHAAEIVNILATNTTLSSFDNIASATNLTFFQVEGTEDDCNPIPLNIAFGFLIYSWICVPLVIACQILHYQSVLSARELLEKLKSKQQKNRVIEPFELEFKL